MAQDYDNDLILGMNSGTERWIHLLFRGDQPQKDVLNTDEDQSDEYIVEFRKKGLMAICIPVLEFSFRNIEELSSLLIESSLNNEGNKYSTGLIITSPRAVEAIGKAVQLISSKQERDKILEGIEKDLILVVGEVSGKKLQSELGIEYNSEAAKTGNVKALVKYIEENINRMEVNSTLRFIYPKSSRSENVIETAFQNVPRIDIKPIVSYETKPASNLKGTLTNELARISFVEKGLTDKFIFNLIFFSPSGLESFLSFSREKFVQQLELIFPGNKIESRYSSIGKTTEEALLRENIDVFCVSKMPNAASLVESILMRGV